MSDTYTFGIEEEYFLADASTGRSPVPASADRFHAAVERSGLPATPELLKGQVEVVTPPSANLDETGAVLRKMRRTLADLAGAEGLRLFAAGTHPLASSAAQETTDKPRYQELAADFGLLAHRMMVCATHVHVEVPAPEARVPLMRRLMPHLPLLLALSVGSPYWNGEDAGMEGFRLAAFSEWPRMGLPELLETEAEYRRLVHCLVSAGAIRDASYLWWYIRPSAKFPTLEMRICDSCTRVDDVVALAALYRCLVRTAVLRPETMPPAGPVERMVAAENVWQAQRHGVRATFVDAMSGTARPVKHVLDAALALVSDAADAFGCGAVLAKTRDIVALGSGADLQRDAYRQARAGGADHDGALQAVVRRLAEVTLA